MYKKILLFVIIAMSCLIVINQPVDASTTDWVKNETDGYYYYVSLPTSFDGSFIEIDITVEDTEILEVKDFVLGVYSELYDTDGNVQKSITVQFVPDNGTWYDVNIIFGDKTMTMWANLLYGYDDFLSIRKLVSVDDIPDDAFSDVSDLPTTTDTDEFLTDVGHVSFTVDGYDLIVTITYYGTYKLHYIMESSVDMELFDSLEAYYINLNDTPQIWINNATDGRTLRSILSDETAAQFVPHSIWDLNTNSIHHVNTYNAYAYLKQNEDGVVIAYFYVDEFIIDKILTATLTYTARIHSTNWFGLYEEYSEWERVSWQYESDDYLTYRDLTTNWTQYIPIYNIISTAIKTGITYDMPRITQVNKEAIQEDFNITLDELDYHFSNVYEDFASIESDSRYNVFAFALQEGAMASNVLGEVQTEIYHNYDDENDANNFKVVQIVYETDGIIYTTLDDEIDTIVDIDDGLQDDADSGLWQMILDALTEFFENYTLFALLIVVVLAMVFIGGIVIFLRGLRKPLKAFFSPLGVVIAVIIGLAILVFLGT